MNKYIIINASPRTGGTSAMLAEMCKTFLNGNDRDATIMHLYKSDITELINALSQADTVIVSGPCYVNSYPAPVINMLEQWAKRAPENQAMYGIIQGGMPYMHTHQSGLNMLQLFAKQAGISYKGGFILGLGAMVDGKGIDKLPNGKKAKQQLDIFFANIRDGSISGDDVYERARMRFPSFVARILSKRMNKSIDEKFAARGFNASQESPYRFDELA